MKNYCHIALLIFSLFVTNIIFGQFGDLLQKAKSIGASQGVKALNMDKLFKKPAAITTAFEDVNRNGEQQPDFMHGEKIIPLTSLSKATAGGYILRPGLYEITNKSYCLHAGTFAPSKGDGYMYAPTAGPKKDIVIAILKNAESHPEIQQHSIQVLLWTIIARTRFIDFAGEVKLTAIALLTPKQLTQLEGGALGVLPVDLMQKAKSQLPSPVQSVFEAENNIRQLVASGNYSYADMEKYAILAGMAPPRADVPSGIWTLHPDGYYIRYFPSGYSITRVQIYVPQSLADKTANNGLVYDATDDIACPANTGAQRLAQTNEPIQKS